MKSLNFLISLLKLPLKTLIYYSLMFSFVLCGCNNINKSLNDKSIVIDISLNRNTDINENKIILNKYILLETTKDCTIGIINKILITGNKLIVVDFMKANSTLCFDLRGKFVKKISGIGKASGEYLMNRDFIEKSDGKGFYLFDKKQQKLIEFDDAFTIIKELNIPFSINSLIELQDGSFLVERSSDNNFFVNLCDGKFHVLNEYIERPKYQINYDFNNPYPFKINRTDFLKYNPSFSNIIFEYKDNEFIEKYFIKDNIGFPNKKFFESNKGVHPGRLLPRFQKENFLSFLDFYENDYFLLLKYYRDKNQNIALYNKRNQQVASYNTSDHKIISIILNNVLAIDSDGSFISFIFPYQLSEVDKEDKLREELISKFPGINDKDNPMIVFFDIKI